MGALWRTTGGAFAAWLGLVTALIGSPFSASAGSGQEDNEYQFNVNPYHPLTGRLDMFGNLGYYESSGYTKYRFSLPGAILHVEPWLQLWGGLDNYYTDNNNAADQLELRPFGGVKLFVPNRVKIQLYNFTRYEYRNFENLGTHDWSGYSRIRSRFGAEVPLAARDQAWQPKSFYSLADVEPFYRFDKNEWDPVRVRGGLGYILNDRVRVELIYTAQFTRATPGSSLDFSENIIQLNIKVAMQKGLLDRLLNPGD